MYQHAGDPCMQSLYHTDNEENTISSKSVRVQVTGTTDSITFKCRIQESSEFLGCLAILHGQVTDHYNSTLNLIVREINGSSDLQLPLINGTKNYYAVFPRKITGIIGLQAIDKGASPPGPGIDSVCDTDIIIKSSYKKDMRGLRIISVCMCDITLQNLMMHTGHGGYM